MADGDDIDKVTLSGPCIVGSSDFWCLIRLLMPQQILHCQMHGTIAATNDSIIESTEDGSAEPTDLLTPAEIATDAL